MRQVLDDQKYLNFTSEASLKVVEAYRRKYGRIDELLDANPNILHLVHDDLESLSSSSKGRKAKYTTEILFRAMLVHQIEETALRDTVIRIAESDTLKAFIRLGNRTVPDFTFLDRAFKAISTETWKMVNEELAGHAVKKYKIDVSRIRADSTVVESNIHYPTDSSLLWDSYRVLSRLLHAVREAAPALCSHRFRDKKAKNDFVFITRYMRSGSTDRQVELKRRYRRLLGHVRRLQGITKSLIPVLVHHEELALRCIGMELQHYLPLTQTVCRNTERAALKGEKVPASERIFSIFEEHTELIKRGKSNKPVEFGHAVWLAQARQKFITDYEVMEQKEPDSDLLGEIAQRHKEAFRTFPKVVAADTGFRAGPEEMEKLSRHVETVAVPSRSPKGPKMETRWHHFRAGIEGSISVLKRAFRIATCFYRGFKSFSAAVGMAIFCHNLVNLAPRRAPA
jgi:IS5 family transposase